MGSGILLKSLLAALFLSQYVLGLVSPVSDGFIQRSKNEGCEAKNLGSQSRQLPAGCNDADSELMSRRRRKLLFESSAATLSALILGDSVWAREETESMIQPRQTIVITGANSGVGFEACKRLARRGHRLVLACRTISKAQLAAERLSDFGGAMIPAECDLASLSSIQSFVSQLPKLIGNSKIDCLCLNAGLCRNTASSTEIVRTVDGFELTVGTNHFGHFYLNHLLLPSVDKVGGRIVVTASGVHDPESPGGAQGETATLGDLLGLESQGKDCEMLDGGKFNADKAYKDSKVTR
jgi:NAD(P)-dependent dehydrogenase (short-subunit alcohol dehydrogenase family)